ncbi:Uncharacterised protein [Mycolicibacterium smegmatis]|jgi:hypothetical protein|uniref:Uncharacterized protein n=1 Tax=Mycolicibacterium smegmatis (strain MKD8) TaxID=1214915 RepID=A0A2U9PSR6_MYCSE|nr:hypothetical protein D806_038550 [Mycolicibacterium smegmatis MKD8]CKI04994.1 Uncharacterised protein [Mycolicibacterium smegmatis]SUA34000.1 Uncharacterised protein [Mycolicibacterium smegmatis]VTP08859.1 hypothetical protein BIN_B_03188 [Mycolicibacterium smegmatis]
MVAFGVFVAVVAGLVAVTGRPYRRSWHERFGEMQL